ncbi:MAG: Glutamine--fructose-6-phosphate aminotransferase (isomerizing) [Firmicutes bacterium ADurb.Bin419]|nr:MAG: Glutamine--fructose-6-phosphate aminotransferase (isomerizing) [Firmicutes bacterium ADurb.Bin419]
MAFVGKQNSPLAKNADHIVDVSVPFMGKCPGVRTYQANLLGLMIFSIMVGERKKIIDSEEAQKLLIELQHIPDIIDNHIQNLQDSVAKVAKSIKLQPAILFLGSGPSFGTAKFCAAKVCEACSIISFGQDLEEFAHVENLCYPDDMPIFIISPRGKSEWRAVEIAKFAQSIGKQVMILSDVNNLDFPNDLTMAAYLSATISEQFSPLVFHIPGTLLAAHLTKELNRKLFRSDQLTTRTRYFSNTSVYDIEY